MLGISDNPPQEMQYLSALLVVIIVKDSGEVMLLNIAIHLSPVKLCHNTCKLKQVEAQRVFMSVHTFCVEGCTPDQEETLLRRYNCANLGKGMTE